MKRIAFLFPGQGSQKIGMGQDLYHEFNFVRDLFNAAEQAAQLPIAKLCFDGPMEALTQTVNLQPAVTTINLSCLTAIAKQNIQPHICAGHSLGEYSALYAAGIVSTEDCLKLVLKRGQLMHQEAIQHQGAMSAIVGLNIDQVHEIVNLAAQDGVVAVANHNSAEQIVITGAPDAVQRAGQLAKEQGARVIPLRVSGAWHSPLIQGAEMAFRDFLNSANFKTPACPVIHNVTADTQDDPEQIKSLMAQQLCSPVRWYDSMLKMIQSQVEVFVEIGPGQVLTGLLKKIVPSNYEAEIFNVYDLKSLERFLEKMN